MKYQGVMFTFAPHEAVVITRRRVREAQGSVVAMEKSVCSRKVKIAYEKIWF